MPVPGDIFAELKLILEASQQIDRLAREGLEHQAAGRTEYPRRCLEQAEEIEQRIKALTAGRRRT